MRSLLIRAALCGALLLALAGCSNEADKVCAAFDSGEHKTITQAATAMAELGPAKVSQMAGVLRKDDDPQHRQIAARALKRLGPDALPALDALIWAAGSEEARLRQRSIEAIGAIGPDAAPALEALRRATQDSDPKVRRAAARAIGELGPAGRSAALDLVAMFDRGDRSASREAISALRRIEAPVDEVQPEIMLRLDDPEARVRGAAVDALTAVGKADEAALAKLRELVLDPESEVRTKAVRAYRSMGGDAAALATELIAALSDPSADRRHAACSALRKLGSDAKPALPRLRELSNDPDRKVAQEAAAALQQIERAQPPSPVELRVGVIKGLRGREARHAVHGARERLIECLGDSGLRARADVLIEVNETGDVKAVNFDPPLSDANVAACIEEAFFKLDMGEHAAAGTVELALYLNMPAEGSPLMRIPDLGLITRDSVEQNDAEQPGGGAPEPEQGPEDESE